MATEPSIAMIPSGYKASKIYSTLPTNGDADLDFSRSGVANRINSDGLIEEMAIDVPRLDYTDGTCPSLLLEPQSTNLITYPISFGNSYWTKSDASIEGDASTAGVEQVTNGDFATDSDWDKGVDWVISGGVATSSASSNSFAKLTTIGSNLVVGKTYLITYTVLNYVSNTVVFTDGVAVGNARNGNGTYSEYYTARGTEITFRSYGQFNGSIDNVSVKEVQGFSAPSVDNPTSAFKLVEGTSTGEHYIIKSFSGLSTTNKTTFSIRAKKAERSWIAIQFSSAYVGWFDLENGIVGTQFGGTGFMKLLSNGYYQIECNAIASNSTSSLFIENADADSSRSYTGDGTSGVYIFGAQLEELPYATSLMLPNTEGQQATRVAETASKTVPDGVIGQTEGTMYVNVNLGKSTIDSSSSPIRFNLNNGVSANNWIFVGIENGDNLRVYVRANASSSVDFIKNGVFPSSGNYKIAMSFKSNETKCYVNGILQYNSNSGIIPNNLDSIGLGAGITGNSVLVKSQVKEYKLYNTALTDAELTTLTTI